MTCMLVELSLSLHQSYSCSQLWSLLWLDMITVSNICLYLFLHVGVELALSKQQFQYQSVRI